MKENVLVVEDEELMRVILRQLLEDEGFRVLKPTVRKMLWRFLRAKR